MLARMALRGARLGEGRIEEAADQARAKFGPWAVIPGAPALA
jgi:hypothetical protein